MLKRPIIFANAGKFTARKPLRITAEVVSGVAMIRIIGSIYEWNQNNSTEIGLKIDEYLSQGVKDCHVYLKSQGGNVWEAGEIVNLLKKFPGKVTGEGGVMVASAATRIACECSHFKMAANGQYMWHKPMGGAEGNEDDISSTLKMIQNATKEYKAAYAKRTGKTEQQIEELWSKGDVWMTAQEAKENGFIDEVIADDETITAEDIAELTACGSPNIPKLKITNSKKIITMDPVLLGLPADATKEQMEAKVKELQAEAAKAKTLENAQKEKDASEKNAKISALLDAGIRDHKFKAEARPHFKALLEADFDNTKSVIDAMTPVTQLSAHVGGDGPAADGIDRSKWTYADYMEKDMKALEVMRDKEPAKFDLLAKAYYEMK